MKQRNYERELKSYLLAQAKSRLTKLCVNTPKITNAKLNGYRLLTVDDLGRSESTWGNLTLDFTDTYMFCGELHIDKHTAIYDGKDLVAIN